MTEPNWVDKEGQLREVAAMLEAAPWIGIDTEFMRERTFFPKLCLLQVSTPEHIWCIDTLKISNLAALSAAFVDPRSQKILHAARQDLEAIFLATRQIVAPVFDTQVAAGCVGMKPQLGYADLAKTLLDVSITKSQTRTDWSRRPLSAAQLAYAADDVKFLHEIALRLRAQLEQLGRTSWADEDFRQLANPELYDLDPSRAWTRLKGIAQLAPRAAGIARAAAVWRERLARERDTPRTWILSDTAIFNLAQTEPTTLEQLRAAAPELADFRGDAAGLLLEDIARSESLSLEQASTHQDQRPTPAQKSLINRLSQIVDQRASELGLSAEVLVTRGEIKSLVMGRRRHQILHGWRAAEIGGRLLQEVAQAKLD